VPPPVGATSALGHFESPPGTAAAGHGAGGGPRIATILHVAYTGPGFGEQQGGRCSSLVCAQARGGLGLAICSIDEAQQALV
jgi:hypothetical protein